MDDINLDGLVNKPPIHEIANLDLVNKPDILSDELKHFGILGMRWGVRRYQNPDGSLTELGKRRAANMLSKREKAVAKKIERAKLRENRKKERFEKKKQKILKDPDLIVKYQDLLTSDEITRAKNRLVLMNDIHKLRQDKIQRGKNYAEVILKYGDLLNKGIDLINSNAGKGIRQMMGFSTKDIWKFDKDKKKDKKKDRDDDE